MEYTLEDTERIYGYLLSEIERAMPSSATQQIHQENLHFLLGKMYYCLLEERRRLHESVKENTQPEPTPERTPPVRPVPPTRPEERLDYTRKA
jgi:hypothetical protein